LKNTGIAHDLETKERIAKALGVDLRKIWPTTEQSNPPTAA
jgi:lambda repressor-like predicted transcriptional regulator